MSACVNHQNASKQTSFSNNHCRFTDSVAPHDPEHMGVSYVGDGKFLFWTHEPEQDG